MKNRIYIGMLGLLLALASCSQSEELPQTDNGRKTVTFTAQPDYGLNTRAVNDPKDNKPTRAILEVYDKSGKLMDSRLETTNLENGGFTFTLELETTEQYDCYFWADANDYNVTDLADITYNADADMKKAIAFSARLENFTPSLDAKTVTLKHAVAKMVVKETGTLADGDEIGISFTCPGYSYNLKTNTYTEAAGSSITIDLPHTAAADANTGDLLSAYLLVPADGVTVDGVGLSYTPKDLPVGEAPFTTQLTNVPFKANYRTVFTGHFPDLDNQARQSFSVSMNTEWEGAEETFGVGVDATNHTITLPEAGKLTAAFITSTLNGGSELAISGPMNNDDVDVLRLYLRSDGSGANANLDLDLSGASLPDVPAFSSYFDKMTGLRSIILPEGVTELDDYCFSNGSNLVSVILPNSLVTIGAEAFKGCEKLETIYMGGVTKFNYYDHFSGCTALRELDFSGCTSVPVQGAEGDFLRNFPSFTGVTLLVASEDMKTAFAADSKWGKFTNIEVKQP